MSAGERRLGAIMFTDVVGYVALTQQNERLALAVLEGHRRLLRPIFPRHHGREIKTVGDAFLVEFDSALEATECALEIQRFLAEFNATSREDWKVQLRVGIHLGDVVHAEGDVLGDAVNLAARIEPLADPGGVCISEQVYAQVRGKLECGFERLEGPSLKNVRIPVEVYRLVPSGSAPTAATAASSRTRLAVLPFAYIGADVQDEYFADGLTEELITELAQLTGLRVIGHTSVNRYRGTKESLSQIGRELGVGSILEGSVRKAGGMVRVTAQLIDAATEEHTWAGTYDRPLENVLEIQSDIARQVSHQLRVRILPEEGQRLSSAPAVHPESYLACLRGRTFLQARSRDALRGARDQFERALALDPKNARAYAGLADAIELLRTYHAEGSASRTQREQYLRTALELDPNLAEAHASLGYVLRSRYDFVGSEREFRRAIALNASYSTAHHWYALLLEDLGRVEDAFREFAAAERADPLAEMTLFGQVQLLTWVGRLDEAEERLARLREVAKYERMVRWGTATLAEARGDKAAYIRDLEWLASGAASELDRLTDESALLEAQGDRPGALRVFEKILKLPYDEESTARALAACYAYLGQPDEALEWLAKALKLGTLELRFVRFDRAYASLRKDPRLAALLRELNIAVPTGLTG